jgi:hypothetical protein
MMAKTTKKDFWMEQAECFAWDAHENHFESRRGSWPIADKDGKPRKRPVICLYNNNPYKDPAWREEETAEIRKRMALVGIKELAYATYPPEGDESAGYTYALIMEGPNDFTDWLKEIVLEITAKVVRQRMLK